MAKPGLDKATERPLDELVQTVSERAVVLVREEVDLARQELTAKARHAATGVAMVGGAALLGTLAAGTGTAGVVLLLSGRARPAASSFGVTALYAAGGAALAQEGIARLRGAAPPIPEETVGSVKESIGSMKRKRTKPATQRSRNGG